MCQSLCLETKNKNKNKKPKTKNKIKRIISNLVKTLLPNVPLSVSFGSSGAKPSDSGVTPPVLLEGLGSQGSITLDCINPSGGVQSRIRERAPVDPCSFSGIPVPGSSQTGYSGGGGPLFTPEECYRRGDGSLIPGVLLKDVFGYEEDRRLASHNRSECVEPISSNSDLQDGISRVHQGFSAPRVVDFLPGSERCLSACSYPSSRQEISEVLFQGSNFPVQGPPLRSVSSSMAFHQGSFGGEGYGTQPGGSASSIPGRLVGESHHSRRMPGPCSQSSATCRGIGLAGQLPKIRSHPQTDFYFSGDSLRSSRVQSVPYSKRTSSS